MSRYFVDAEFNSFGGELISIALVRQDGKSISLVLGCDDPHPWVAENVMPVLFSDPASRKIARADLANELFAFLRADLQIEFVCDWPDDIKYLCESLMTAPGEMVALPRATFQLVRCNAYPTTVQGAIQHNCYWDAMALRDLFTK